MDVYVNEARAPTTDELDKLSRLARLAGIAIKRQLDPEGLFTSDLARRVGIDPVLNKRWPE